MSRVTWSVLIRSTVIALAVVVAVSFLVRWIPPGGPRVAIAGDSITLVSGPSFYSEMGHEYRVDLRAWLGATARGMETQVHDLARHHPRIAVVNLGSNDVLQGKPLDQAVATVGEYVQVFRNEGATCIHLVNLNTGMLAAGQSPVVEDALWFNSRLTELADGAEDVELVDWDGALAAAGDRRSVMVPDTVHPDAPGADLLARTVADSVRKGCG